MRQVLLVTSFVFAAACQVKTDPLGPNDLVADGGGIVVGQGGRLELDPSAVAGPVHNHDGDYLPMGSTLSCGGTDKVTGITAAGDVVCNSDVDTTYTDGAGIAFSGAGPTTISADFTAAGGDSGSSTQVARGDHVHDALYGPALDRATAVAVCYRLIEKYGPGGDITQYYASLIAPGSDGFTTALWHAAAAAKSAKRYSRSAGDRPT